ncbi:hypothetical protein [Capnocytophaga sputigena]|jgi:hypothetical protein|uniref:hypothetical protein n=1 Tax=Capnocytophaga sputigena TaxID=1019 RepID=UPI0028D056FC|nr:hypothetical protein [Capnocytophaga sputigena]
MKSLDLNQMSNIQGGSDLKDFASGFLCAAGLLTINTGIGLVLAIASCGVNFLE